VQAVVIFPAPQKANPERIKYDGQIKNTVTTKKTLEPLILQNIWKIVSSSLIRIRYWIMRYLTLSSY